MKDLIYMLIDLLFYFFDFEFRSNKKKAIKKIYNLINDDRIDVSWKKANDYLTAVKNSRDLIDIRDFLIEEIKQILGRANSNIDYFNEQTKWFKFSDIKVAVGHSTLDNSVKDSLEQQLIILGSIAKTFDLSN